MCRWLAYTGSPVLLDDLLYKPEHSLVVQSLHSRLGRGDHERRRVRRRLVQRHSPTPGVFRSIEPAWSDRNLRELAAHVRSPRGLRAHPRVHRLAGAADELPPVPARPLAVDAQRVPSPGSPR